MRESMNRKLNASTAPNIRHLITLGTPFWGSAVANMGQGMRILGHFPGTLPASQLQNLAIGARTTSLARVWMVNRHASASEADWREGTPWVSRFPEGLAVFNIAGALGGFLEKDKSWGLGRLAVAKALKPSYYEHDLVVSAAEARADFLYFIENSQPSLPPLKGRTRFASEFYPLKLAHIGVFGYPDLAGVTNENQSTHPVLAIVSSILDGSYTTASPSIIGKSLVTKLGNFTSEVKLITPVGYNRRFQIAPTSIEIIPDEPAAFEKVRLPSAVGFTAEGQNPYAIRLKNNFYQTYYHIGRFADSHSYQPISERTDDLFAPRPQGYGLRYRMKIPGFEEKIFTAQVMPSFTSYAEVFLQPDHPVAPVNSSREGAVVGAALVGKEKVAVFRLKGGNVITEVKPGSDLTQAERAAAAESCVVGFAAGTGVPDTERSSYLASGKRPKREKNKLILFTNFSQGHNAGEARTGEPLEILGRVAQGYRDPVSGLSRRCTDEEQVALPRECAGGGRDRYLVTSPAIRAADGGSLTATLGAGKGTRWVDVSQVDIIRDFPTKGANPRSSACLKDDSSRSYYPSGHYQKLYYSIPD